MKTPRLWGKKSVGPYLYVILYVITNGKDGVNGVNGVGFKTFSGKKIINSYYIVDNNYLFFSEKVWILTPLTPPYTYYKGDNIAVVQASVLSFWTQWRISLTSLAKSLREILPTLRSVRMTISLRIVVLDNIYIISITNRMYPIKKSNVPVWGIGCTQ